MDSFVVPTWPIPSRRLHPPPSTLATAEIRSTSTEGQVGVAPHTKPGLDHRPTSPSGLALARMTYRAPDLGDSTGRSLDEKMLPKCTTYLPVSRFFFWRRRRRRRRHQSPSAALVPLLLSLPSPSPPPSRASKVGDEDSMMCYGSEDVWQL